MLKFESGRVHQKIEAIANYIPHFSKYNRQFVSYGCELEMLKLINEIDRDEYCRNELEGSTSDAFFKDKMVVECLENIIPKKAQRGNIWLLPSQFESRECDTILHEYKVIKEIMQVAEITSQACNSVGFKKCDGLMHELN